MNIVLLGASGGIGNCLLKHLCKKHNLYIGYRNFNKVKDILNDNINGSEINFLNFEDMNNFLIKANKTLRSIDIIINCIGSLLLKPAHATTQNELEETLRINLFSCFSILKYGYKFLRKNGGGIIFFSSATAKIGLKNHEAIACSKGAISSLIESSASTYAKNNIRINGIAPGLVDTPLTKNIIQNEISLSFSKKMHGLNRIGKPSNFIPIIDCLIDSKSDWITGQIFSIDGGLSNLK